MNIEEIEIIKNVTVDERIEINHYETCPLCKKELTKQHGFVHEYSCMNGCYILRTDYDWARYVIFGQLVFVDDNDWVEEKNNQHNIVRQLIAYYRENDRYLVEILTQ